MSRMIRSLNISTVEKMESLEGSFHSGNFCECSEKRILQVLYTSISKMFDLQYLSDLAEVCKSLVDDVHILVNVEEIKFLGVHF